METLAFLHCRLTLLSEPPGQPIQAKWGSDSLTLNELYQKRIPGSPFHWDFFQQFQPLDWVGWCSYLTTLNWLLLLFFFFFQDALSFHWSHTVPLLMTFVSFDDIVLTGAVQSLFDRLLVDVNIISLLHTSKVCVSCSVMSGSMWPHGL